MHNFGTCVSRTPAQWRHPKKKRCLDAGKIGCRHCAAVLETQAPWRNPIFPALKHVFSVTHWPLRTHLPLRSLLSRMCSRNTSPEVVHRPRSQSPLHVDIRNISSFADHVYKTTDESFRFHNKNFDEMRCKLDSTENPRSFEKYPTPPP